MNALMLKRLLSFFEDLAQYGYGILQSVQARRKTLFKLIQQILQGNSISLSLREKLEKILKVWNTDDSIPIARLINQDLKLISRTSYQIQELISQSDILARKLVWMVGPMILDMEDSITSLLQEKRSKFLSLIQKFTLTQVASALKQLKEELLQTLLLLDIQKLKKILEQLQSHMETFMLP
jgi:hypothetical protein